MDTTQLISDAKARFAHNSAKAYLKDKYQSKLIVAEQGGFWTVTPDLISFLHSLKEPNVVIIDNFGNPVKVERRNLLIKLTETYNTVMNEWYAEWKSNEGKR
jgi:hypothetical protein